MNEVLDWLVKHQVRLLQFGAAVQVMSIQEVDESEADVALALSALAASLSIRGQMVRADDAYIQGQVASTLDKIKEARERGISRAFDALRVEVSNLTKYEPAFMVAVAQPHIPRPLSVPTAFDSLVSTLPVMGGQLDNWQTRFIQNDAWRVQQSLWTGLSIGDSEAQLRARLLGHAAYRGADGAFQVLRNDFATLVTSTIATFADAARLQTLIQEQLASKEQLVAVLDSRTTPQCRRLNGSIYNLLEGPRPPLHYNCRTIRVPLVGEAPIEVPSFADWLGRQEKEFQVEVLGKRQSEEFQAGRYSPEGFRDRRWRGLTIQELAAREGRAFQEAGMAIPFQ